MLSAIAQFENEIRAERQKDGIEKAKARGVPFGRHKTLNSPQIAKLVAKRQQEITIGSLIKEYNISKATVYHYLADRAK
jgi:DNA invertase Pin-like site-specific DNA recombinase